MGRPLNKRNFKSGAGNQLAVRAKIGSNAEGDGFIVEQTGESRYIATVGANTGIVYLVDKDNGSLAANEATITLQDVDSNTKRAKKILSHRVVFFDGTVDGWSFDPATDGIWEVADVEDGFAEVSYVITIDEQPTSTSALEGETATFSIVASVVPAGQISYQWQTSGEGWVDVVDDSIFSGAQTDTLTISPVPSELDGVEFQCIAYVTGIEGDGVVSDQVSFTLAP